LTEILPVGLHSVVAIVGPGNSRRDHLTLGAA
jgi:hypothetical protein